MKHPPSLLGHYGLTLHVYNNYNRWLHNEYERWYLTSVIPKRCKLYNKQSVCTQLLSSFGLIDFEWIYCSRERSLWRKEYKSKKEIFMIFLIKNQRQIDTIEQTKLPIWIEPLTLLSIADLDNYGNVRLNCEHSYQWKQQHISISKDERRIRIERRLGLWYTQWIIESTIWLLIFFVLT